MLTKVNSKTKISQFHNLGPQILKKTQKLKSKILTTQISLCETDGIVQFHLTLETPKVTLLTI